MSIIISMFIFILILILLQILERLLLEIVYEILSLFVEMVKVLSSIKIYFFFLMKTVWIVIVEYISLLSIGFWRWLVLLLLLNHESTGILTRS
jgi:hypothetical protein